MLTASRAQITVLVISLGLSCLPLHHRVDAVTQRSRAIAWNDLPGALQRRLTAAGLDADGFSSWVAARRTANVTRVREGDEEHAVFYALQSTRITRDAPIEPAVSARQLVTGLPPEIRQQFLDDPESLAPTYVPAPVRVRLVALRHALDRRSLDPRLDMLRGVLVDRADVTPAPARPPATIDARLVRAYYRAMRFLYRQSASADIAPLYRTRGLSTDTSLEAGFIVREGLATLHTVEPARRVRHAVIIGPGLDLAPRTGLSDDLPPQSLQPFAVADALLSLGMSEPASLRITCLDINPRVVHYLDDLPLRKVTLIVAPGLRDASGVETTDAYRRYVDTFGQGIGDVAPAPAAQRRVSVRSEVAQAIDAAVVDAVVDRVDLAADLVIVTNVLPYFDEVDLTLAVANIAAMLQRGGVLLHNEARRDLADISSTLGLPLIQSRSEILARAGSAPPYLDTFFLHRMGG